MTSKRNEKIITVLAIAVLAYAGFSYYTTGNLFSPPGDLFKRKYFVSFRVHNGVFGVEINNLQVSPERKASLVPETTLGLVCIEPFKGRIRAKVKDPTGATEVIMDDQNPKICKGDRKDKRTYFTAEQEGKYKVTITLYNQQGGVLREKSQTVEVTEQ